MCLNSYRAVHNHLQALMSVVTYTWVPGDHLVAHDTWVSCVCIWKVSVISFQAANCILLHRRWKGSKFHNLTSVFSDEREKTPCGMTMIQPTTFQHASELFQTTTHLVSNCQLTMSNVFVKFLESVGRKMLPTTFLFLKSNKNDIFWTILFNVTNDSESAQIITLFSSWLKRILAKIFAIGRCRKMVLVSFCIFKMTTMESFLTFHGIYSLICI